MSEKSGLSDVVFSYHADSLANGASLSSGWRDAGVYEKYQIDYVASASGLTLETITNPFDPDTSTYPDLTNSFTYTGNIFFLGTFLVRQRFIKINLKNNTGSTVTNVSLDVKLIAEMGDGATAIPLNHAPSTSDTSILTQSILAGQGSGSTYNNVKVGSDGAIRTASYPYEYDYIDGNNPTDTQEIYTYKTGGSGGTTVGTITINYTDSTKAVMSNVART